MQQQQQQQEDDGRGGDRRLKATQAEWKAQIQPPPTQKCPRCESLNTKFCYYNNYSFSQPRYFCKNCRRYWTQGGTLRNVRAGCGVRKGKRVTTKNSSSSCQEPPPQKVVQMEPNLTAPVITVSSNEDSSTVGSPSPAVSISPFYQGGGGFLASLAAIHSLNPSQPFDQSLDVGGDGMGGSSLGLLSGFMGSSLCSQNHQQDQSQISSSQFYQMGMRDDQDLIQSTMSNSTISASRHDWPQSFMNNANHMASDASLWSTVSTTSTGGNSQSTAIGGSFSLIPNDQWPDLPGYDPPP